MASGGAAGALLRFSLISIYKVYFQNYFYSTLLINIMGCFLIGYLISIGYVKNISDEFIKYFLIIGFLGSFTTFSAFSHDVIELFLSNKIFLSSFYIILSVVSCIVATYIGMYINKFWLK